MFKRVGGKVSQFIGLNSSEECMRTIKLAWAVDAVMEDRKEKGKLVFNHSSFHLIHY